MVNRENIGIFHKLRTYLDDVHVELERLNNVAEMRPREPEAVLKSIGMSATAFAEFEIGPVVFHLPERADRHTPNLFVVLKGRFAFKREDDPASQALRTHDFATQVAYFRQGKDVLRHVYGAHYDFAENELGHPIFHAQMRSLADYHIHVRRLYQVDHVRYPLEDSVEGLLKTVRLPIAQMDAFSTILQVFADHLLSRSSGPEERAAFNSLLNKSTFWQGAAFQFCRLGRPEAYNCYRAFHWYPLQ